MRTRVYIAGPISHGDLAENIRQAEEAFYTLLKAGYSPFCPHWSCYGSGPKRKSNGVIYALANSFGREDMTHEDWMGADLPWVEVSDALLRLPGKSVGADREVETARINGIPIFTNIGNLISKVQLKGDQLKNTSSSTRKYTLNFFDTDGNAIKRSFNTLGEATSFKKGLLLAGSKGIIPTQVGRITSHTPKKNTSGTKAGRTKTTVPAC